MQTKTIVRLAEHLELGKSEVENLTITEAQEINSYLDNVKCRECKDSGIATITEWVGTDDSYQTETTCRCQFNEED